MSYEFPNQAGQKPIRLRKGDMVATAIGSELRAFLNGQEVDLTTVWALDESAGWIDFLISEGAPVGGGRPRFAFDIDPKTEERMPRLNRVTGHVRVSLKGNASVAVRRIYDQLRDGSLQAKLDILRGAMTKP